jgi:hypothetical protein
LLLYSIKNRDTWRWQDAPRGRRIHEIFAASEQWRGNVLLTFHTASLQRSLHFGLLHWRFAS